ncbi:MAG: serine incorporator domain-containing protein, partial [Pseudomonadota bacterium]|nr:serine incorporator domain-containing protein [Pseudomonadota bacterium]
AMVLTNWAKQPKDNNWDQSEDLNVSDESMWIKLASMFLTVALYFWIIVAPFLFPNRDFGSAAQ